MTSFRIVCVRTLLQCIEEELVAQGFPAKGKGKVAVRWTPQVTTQFKESIFVLDVDAEYEERTVGGGSFVDQDKYGTIRADLYLTAVPSGIKNEDVAIDRLDKLTQAVAVVLLGKKWGSNLGGRADTDSDQIAGTFLAGVQNISPTV